MTERLEERHRRLEQERQDADRQYNDALTALDRALSSPVAPPGLPSPYDTSRLAEANDAWDLPRGPGGANGVKGRLRGAVWRMLTPLIEAQRRFYSIVVDHLTRNVKAHEGT